MAAQERLARTAGSLFRHSGSDVLILLPRAEEAVVLRGAAALVWLLLEPPCRRDELVSVIEAAQADGDLVGIAAEDIGLAVDEVLDVLVGAGAVTSRPDSRVDDA